ncbi:MAG: glycosyltransferase family 9 protein [Pseudomonadota bacterium]
MFGRKSAKKILIIKFDRLSEFVNADAAFAAIRAAHPTDKITLLTKPDFARLAKAAPYFDTVATDAGPKDAENQRLFNARLKKEGFHIVYDLDRSQRTKKIFNAMRPFPPKWSGAAPGCAYRYEPVHGNIIDDFAAQLEAAGVACQARRPELAWALDARKDSANMQPSWYGLTGPFALLAPGNDGDKRWPTDKWAGLAQTISELGVIPVLIGGTEKQAIGHSIVRQAPSTVNLMGKTDLLQAAGLAAAAAFYVADDTAPAHLFASVGCGGVMPLSVGARLDLTCPRGRDAVAVTAASLEDVSVAQILRTLRNAGHFSGRAVRQHAPQRAFMP